MYDKERIGIVLCDSGYQNNRTEEKKIVPHVYRKEYKFVNQFGQGHYVSIVFDTRPNNHITLWIFDHQTMDYIDTFKEIKHIKEMGHIAETISNLNVQVINGRSV